jgi:hypothetical protein
MKSIKYLKKSDDERTKNNQIKGCRLKISAFFHVEKKTKKRWRRWRRSNALH